MLNVHEEERNRLKFKNNELKSKFDVKSHMISFDPGQKVWFYIPHRAIESARNFSSIGRVHME